METERLDKQWIFWRVVGSSVEQEAKGAAKKMWDVCVGCIKGMFNFGNKNHKFHQLQPGRYIYIWRLPHNCRSWILPWTGCLNDTRDNLKLLGGDRAFNTSRKNQKVHCYCPLSIIISHLVSTCHQKSLWRSLKIVVCPVQWLNLMIWHWKVWEC